MGSDILVTKRDGSVEPLDLNKFHKVVMDSCEGITGVSPSEIELKSHLSFYDKIKTSEIQETLIKAAADLISEETPNYQYVAGRLINYHLRKEVYGKFEPPHIFHHVSRVVKEGFYTPELLEWYSFEEWEQINILIDHSRDDMLTYAAMEQFRGKYLVKNRAENRFYETPQFAFILIAAVLFARYGDNRMAYIRDFYNALSRFDISMPTPIMAGVRTPQRQFSSCVLIETDDSLDSINATASSIVKYVSKRAGIGIGAGRIRAINSPIRSGDSYHTGVIPFYKYFQSAVKSCSQGSVRGGAATLYYPIWHYEIEDLLVLKNNKGVEANRVRHMDYGLQVNRLFYERLLSGGNITLFSPSDVPGLYDAFFEDYDTFKELYEKAERKHIRKKTVKAIDLFTSFLQERKDTGRIYLMNVDNVNDHGSFTRDAPIRMSNLCAEVTLPTRPLDSVDDLIGEIALCTLGAINWGNIRDPMDFERPARLIVRALDELLDYQEYPIKAAQNSSTKRRSIGVGIINLAFWLAKHGTNYQNPNLEMIDEYAEAYSYFLIKASIDLAKEKGPCEKLDETKYGAGLFPIDTYKKDVDELVPNKLKLDWEALRQDLREYGIRNSTLMACMPSETSAQISNSTNGVEPPRALVSIKQSKDGVLKQVVPEYRHLKNKYDLLWDQKSPDGYLKIMAVLQKYIDQSISVNTSYNPLHYKDEKIPLSEMIRHLLEFYKYGGKCLYYFNTYDGANDDGVEDKKPELEDAIEEEDCESCKI